MSHFLPIHLMVSNKKDNAALKSTDFLQDLLEDELVQSSKVSEDGDFFDMLVEEVDEQSKAGANLKVVPVETNVDVTNFEVEDVDLASVEELHPNKRVSDRRSDKTSAFDDKTSVLDDDKPQSLESVSDMGAVASGRNPLIDLKNADYVKAAQEKVLRLEKELMSLRQENQELAVAGDHFKGLSEDQKRRIKTLEAEVGDLDSTFSEEKEILMESISAKELRIEALQVRVEDLEEQIQTKFNRLRMRERELESRLEIIKQENEAVAHSKDDMLVDLKKQTGSLTEDLERSRSQYQKALDKLNERDDALRRTVKALKLSLTMLESQKQKD